MKQSVECIFSWMIPKFYFSELNLSNVVFKIPEIFIETKLSNEIFTTFLL